MVGNMSKFKKKNVEKLSPSEFAQQLIKRKNWKDTLPRPSVSHDKYCENYDNIFKNKEKEEEDGQREG